MKGQQQDGATNKAAVRKLESQLTQLLPKIQALLPARAGDPQRFVRMVLMSVTRQPKLLLCDRASLLLAVMAAAELGLSVSGGPASRAHLIPFRGKVVCVPDFKGLIDIALASGKVDSIEADVVREGDKFHYVRGTDPKLEHVPLLDGGGATLAAYAIAWPSGGARPVWQVMSASELDQVRDSSRGYQYAKEHGDKSHPWIAWRAEMEKKSAIKRLWKWLPSTPEMQRAIEIDTASDDGSLEALAVHDVSGVVVDEAEREERATLIEQVSRRRLAAPKEVDSALSFIGYDEGTPAEHVTTEGLRALTDQLARKADKEGSDE